MNCRSFAEIVSGIARAELMEASEQDAAREHAASCRVCQARLSDERTLSEALLSLASADRERPVPLVDESGLRIAFRENLAAANGASRGKGLASFRYLRWALPIAAALVVTVGAGILWRSTPSERPISIETGTQARQVGTVTAEPGKGGEQVSVEVAKAGPTPERAGRSRMTTRMSARVPLDASYVDVSLGEFQPVSNESEEATDFVPMVQGGDGAPMTSGQVVRVVMPRAAMSYFGLQMNVDRANERVKADVLVGEDGLARAIRFVR